MVIANTLSQSSILERNREILKGVSDEKIIVVFASTTGLGVIPYLDELCHKRFVVIVPHRLGNPRWKPFDTLALKRIRDAGGNVIFEGSWSALLRITKAGLSKLVGSWCNRRISLLDEIFGVHGRVCWQITQRVVHEKFVNHGDKVLAMAGQHTAVVFEILCKTPPKLRLHKVYSL